MLFGTEFHTAVSNNARKAFMTVPGSTIMELPREIAAKGRAEFHTSLSVVCNIREQDQAWRVKIESTNQNSPQEAWSKVYTGAVPLDRAGKSLSPHGHLSAQRDVTQPR